MLGISKITNVNGNHIGTKLVFFSYSVPLLTKWSDVPLPDIAKPRSHETCVDILVCLNASQMSKWSDNSILYPFFAALPFHEIWHWNGFLFVKQGIPLNTSSKFKWNWIDSHTEWYTIIIVRLMVGTKKTTNDDDDNGVSFSMRINSVQCGFWTCIRSSYF